MHLGATGHFPIRCTSSRPLPNNPPTETISCSSMPLIAPLPIPHSRVLCPIQWISLLSPGVVASVPFSWVEIIIELGIGTTAFGNLRYVHLEFCPNIISVFPKQIDLKSLEKIVIKSCPRLRQVFRQVCLSSLTTMELLDLPSLESIGRDIILSPKGTWKLRVRGCWKLRELPTFREGTSVKIDGEPMWWSKVAVNSTIAIVRKK
uniref:Putative disease resistance protein At4g19050 n=1 Tax=Anthurium amnicola TaxID=1678845 RepID=A0A1D1Y851_9ARAE